MGDDPEGLQGRSAAPVQPRKASKRHANLALLGVAALAIAVLTLPVTTGSAQLVWNATASAPPGLYRIEREHWTTGDRVAVLPTDNLAADLDRRGVLPRGKLLIKRVAAAGGDTLCRRDYTVSVNGVILAEAKSNDSSGQPLPSWQGCITLNENQVFLLGDTAGSYDGRYFGETQASQIVGRADLLLSF